MNYHCTLLSYFLLVAVHVGCSADSAARLGRRAQSEQSTETKSGESTPNQDDSLSSASSDNKKGTQEAAIDVEKLNAEFEKAFPGSKLIIPKSGLPAPAVILMHGSEGGGFAVQKGSEAGSGYLAGYGEYLANELGFVAVAYCYYLCEGRPGKLENIELGDVPKLADWLHTALAKGKKVGLFGISRGAEKSLILAAQLKSTDKIAAVAVHAPSDTIVASFNPANENEFPYETIQGPNGATQYRFTPAWKWEGKPVYGESLKNPSTNPATITFDNYATLVNNGPRILIEEFMGPLRVTHGTSDEVWEVDRSRRIEATRKQLAPQYETTVVYVQGAGHVLRGADETTFKTGLLEFYGKHLK